MLFSAMAKVLFIVRKSKSSTNRHFLYCRVTSFGITREFSLEQPIAAPNQWNQDKQLYEREGPEGEFINLLCDKLKFQIKTLSLNSGGTTPDVIIKTLKEPAIKPVSLQILVTQYITWEREHLNFKPGTLKHHETYLKNLWDFEKDPIYPPSATLEWAERFIKWLKSPREGKKSYCKHNTRASRHIEFIKTALDKAVEQKKIKVHDLTFFQAKRDKKKPLIYLNKVEVVAWISARFDIQDLQRSQELFTVQMLTGVSYMDVWSKFEIQEVKDVGKILIGRRGKNNQAFFLPYHPIVEEILKRHNLQLPYLDNSTYNKSVKIIASMLGIQKYITTHTGRRTFIMSHKNEGWDMKTLQEMAGHKSIRTTERYYMEATPDRLINEMAHRNKKGQV